MIYQTSEVPEEFLVLRKSSCVTEVLEEFLVLRKSSCDLPDQ